MQGLSASYAAGLRYVMPAPPLQVSHVTRFAAFVGFCEVGQSRRRLGGSLHFVGSSDAVHVTSIAREDLLPQEEQWRSNGGMVEETWRNNGVEPPQQRSHHQADAGPPVKRRRELEGAGRAEPAAWPGPPAGGGGGSGGSGGGDDGGGASGSVSGSGRGGDGGCDSVDWKALEQLRLSWLAQEPVFSIVRLVDCIQAPSSPHAQVSPPAASSCPHPQVHTCIQLSTPSSAGLSLDGT